MMTLMSVVMKYLFDIEGDLNVSSYKVFDIEGFEKCQRMS